LKAVRRKDEKSSIVHDGVSPSPKSQLASARPFHREKYQFSREGA
jgi:hypothetical protein